LGLTSFNVILQNVTVTSYQVRRHDLLYVGCNVMTSYVRILKWCVSLRRMLVAAVSCMCLRDFQLFRWWIVYIFSKSFLLWRNVLMKHS